jgi:hypothetical protein
MKSCLARDAGAAVPGKVGAGELNEHLTPPLSPSASEADAEREENLFSVAQRFANGN